MIAPQKTLLEKLAYVFMPDDARGVGFVDRAILTLIGSQDAWTARAEEPREKMLVDMLSGLSAQMGIPYTPKLIVYRGARPNASSLSLTGSVAVETKLIDIMTPPQLEAVLGHELSHHRHRSRDLPVTTVAPLAYNAALAVGGGEMLSRMPGTKSKMAFVGAATVGLGATNYVIPRAWQRGCELEADRESALATGKPEHMIGALEALQRYSKSIPATPLPAWREALKPILATHPPTSTRVERLHGLEAQIREQTLPTATVSR